MFDYSRFVSERKSLLVAPAGYGKTYTLAECIKYTPDEDVQLILTHTHAGIASIKEKIKQQNIPDSKYHIETITGFAQKYVNAFYCGADSPAQEDSKAYYPFIVKQAIELFKKDSVLRIISNTYSGLFVDEYQDCTKSQHLMVMELSKVLPTHVLGDSLQGIMDFGKEQLVDFNEDLNGFVRFPDLETPHRWFQEGNNNNLGEALKEIRTELLKEGQKTIDLKKYGDDILYIVNVKKDDIYNPESKYLRGLSKLVNNPTKEPAFENLLIIMPEYYQNKVPKGDVHHRADLKTKIDYSNRLVLLEAFDDKSFYSCSSDIDHIINSYQRLRNINKHIIKDIINPLFYTSFINIWFKEYSSVRVRQKENKEKSIELKQLFDKCVTIPTNQNILDLLVYLKDDLKFKYKRPELVFSILRALKNSIVENISVSESMISHKNIVRRVGRKINGKCIGTTLLTKGLEFDTVAIMDADKFESAKHLYVALTRASKKLIMFTQNDTLILK